MSLVPKSTWDMVKAIRERGNREGVIREWFAGMKAWAEANRGADAAALKTWLEIVRPRPFYNARELAGLWPALKLELGIAERMTVPPPALWFEKELEHCRLPILQNADRTCMFWTVDGLGLRQRYFIVESAGYWQKQCLSQMEFEHELFPE